MKKNLAILLFAFLIIAVMAFIFRQPIILKIVEWRLQNYCKDCFGTEFTWDKVSRQENTLIYEKPALMSGIFNAEEMSLQISITDLLKPIHTNIIINNPNIVASEGLLEKLYENFQCDSTRSGHHSLTVTDGKIVFAGYQTPALHFGLEANTTDNCTDALFTGWFDQQGESSNQNRFEVNLIHELDQCYLHTSLHHLKSNLILPLVHFSLPASSPWHIDDGILHGQVQTHISEDSGIRAEGNIAVRHLIITHSTLPIKATVEDVNFRMGGEQPHLLDMAIQSPLVLIFDTHEGSTYHVETAGTAAVSMAGEAFWNLSGKLKQGSYNADVFLEGHAPLVYSDEIVPAEMAVKLMTGVKELSAIFPNIFKQNTSSCLNKDEQLSIVLLSKEKIKNKIYGCDGGIAFSGHHMHFGFDIGVIDSGNRSKWILQQGWFNMPDMPLEQFGWLICSEGEVALGGTANLEGVFDSDSISIRYDTQDLKIENAYFKTVIQNPLKLMAVHHLDFHSGKHDGFIPVLDGTYLDKNTGILLTNVKAQIEMEGDKIWVREIEAFSKDVFLAGNVSVDYTEAKLGKSSVNIDLTSMHGKVSQIQNLFSYYDHQFFSKLPFDGNISLIKEGANFNIDFHPQGFDFNTYVEGALTEGSLSFDLPHISLHDLNLNFVYDHQANTLDISDIQGSLLVGKTPLVDEYIIAGDHIRFLDYAHSQMEFDLWVGDKQRDILRLAGKTLAYDPTQSPGIHFVFDQTLTHFGDVHPSTVELSLKDWSGIESFQLDMEFRLSTLFHDLQRFSRTGLLFLSRSLLKEMNDVKNAEGNLKVDLQYDQQGAQIIYNLIADDLVLNHSKFKKAVLTGRKQGQTWIIDQLLLDQFSLSADLTHSHSNWMINFLGFRYGDSILMGLDGAFSPEKNHLTARLNLLEIELSKLGEISWLRNMADKLNPKGKMRATGILQLDFFKDGALVHADAQTVSSLQSVELQGIHLSDAENIKCHFVSDKGIVLENLKTNLRNPGSGMHPVAIKIEKLGYGLDRGEFDIKNLHFQFPPDSLPWILARLRNQFPNPFLDQVGNEIEKMKEQEMLSGFLNLEYSSSHYDLDIALEKGKYVWQGQEYILGKLAFHADPYEFRIEAPYLYNQRNVLATVHSKINDFSEIELTFRDIPSIDKNPLTILWKYDPNSGYNMSKIEGSLKGIEVKLHPVGHSSLDFNGEIAIDFNEGRDLFSKETEEWLKSWTIGKGYSFQGNWHLWSPSEPWRFEGVMQGKDFEFKGYDFNSVVAEISYPGDLMQAKNIHLEDSALHLVIPEIDTYQDEQNAWRFKIPQISVSDFRPGLLRAQDWAYKESSKPLFIPHLEVNDIQGNVFDPDELTGTGMLQFTTLNRKAPIFIFAIPAEVINRLGLDLKVLNPATGYVYYDINGDKIYLTKLKDVYSDGKLSKFYLPKGAQPSYMDFNGNLSVQVKMKQYNLLFKLAELFTLSIDGTLQKPHYSLQKQLLLLNKFETDGTDG